MMGLAERFKMLVGAEIQNKSMRQFMYTCSSCGAIVDGQELETHNLFHAIVTECMELAHKHN